MWEGERKDKEKGEREREGGGGREGGMEEPDVLIHIIYNNITSQITLPHIYIYIIYNYIY